MGSDGVGKTKLIRSLRVRGTWLKIYWLNDTEFLPTWELTLVTLMSGKLAVVGSINELVAGFSSPAPNTPELDVQLLTSRQTFRNIRSFCSQVSGKCVTFVSEANPESLLWFFDWVFTISSEYRPWESSSNTVSSSDNNADSLKFVSTGRLWLGRVSVDRSSAFSSSSRLSGTKSAVCRLTFSEKLGVSASIGIGNESSEFTEKCVLSVSHDFQGDTSAPAPGDTFTTSSRLSMKEPAKQKHLWAIRSTWSPNAIDRNKSCSVFFF